MLSAHFILHGATAKVQKNLFAMQSFTPKLLVDAVFMEHIKVKTDTFYALVELVNKLTS